MPLPTKPLPSQRYLLRISRYERKTGFIFWRRRPDTTKANRIFNSNFSGKIAGTTMPGGYVVIEISGVSFKASRLIWKMVTGRSPPDYIDHDDRDKSNNRWTNLRAATQQQNSFNARLPRNTSGHRGVSFIRAHGKFRAAVNVDGKKKHIGYFDTAKAAGVAASDVILRTRGEFASLD